MSIPIIVIPHLNRPDLLIKCVRSIDVQLDRLVIIQNGRDEDMPAESDLGRPFVHLKTPQGGFAGSINLGIKLFPATWWMFVSNDVEFAPGDLDRFKGAMTRDYDRLAGLMGNHGFAWFAITIKCVQTIGLMDENFYPIYMDDMDYLRRAKLAGLEFPGYLEGMKTTHAIGGAVTDELADRNRKSFQINLEYYYAKWGGVPANIKVENSGPIPETHVKPFGLNVPLSFWTFNPYMRREQMWRMQ